MHASNSSRSSNNAIFLFYFFYFFWFFGFWGWELESFCGSPVSSRGDFLVARMVPEAALEVGVEGVAAAPLDEVSL